MNVAVVIPWRASQDRLLGFEAVMRFYRATLPDATIVLADDTSPRFSRAGSRNMAVRDATEAGADVLVVNDADTVPPAYALRSAIDACDDGRLHYAYDRFAYLTQTETAAYLTDGRIPDRGLPHNSSVMVCEPHVWADAGGQDTRFDGWGGEDDAFLAAVSTLVGEPRWHAGTAVSLWHESCRDVGSERWQPNGILAARYDAARGNPDAMRALIDERTMR